MKKPIVLLDCDGILSDFMTPFLVVIKSVTGRDVKISDVTSWDIVKHLGIEGKEQDLVYDEIKKPGYCLNLPVLKGAKEGFALLSKVAEVYMVTSPVRGLHWMGERAQWLKDHFDLPSRRIVHTAAKQLVTGDFFVDDSVDNVINWGKHQRGEALLWDTSYNRRENHRRVGGWGHLVQIVEGR